MNAAIEIGVCIFLLTLVGGTMAAGTGWLLAAYVALPFVISFITFLYAASQEYDWYINMWKKWNAKRRLKKFGTTDITDEEEIYLKTLELWWDHTWKEAQDKVHQWAVTRGMCWATFEIPFFITCAEESDEIEFEALYRVYEEVGWVKKRKETYPDERLEKKIERRLNVLRKQLRANKRNPKKRHKEGGPSLYGVPLPKQP